tara:strand:- start:3274 stop:5088 length:1815 start_codon:yes stop_codon:yes gene_type:complete
MKKNKNKIIVPDTSAIINGTILDICNKTIKGFKIIVPIAVLDELQAQASKNREHGFIGLKELTAIKNFCLKNKIEFTYSGDLPSMEDIKLSDSGRMDARIKEVAKQNSGTLVTSDFVQALVAEAEGVDVNYVPKDIKTKGLKFEKFFKKNTLSLHLKEGVSPISKVGKPGILDVKKIRKRILDKDEIKSIIDEIFEAVRVSEDGVIEISKGGATILKLGKYRISITKPPFSDLLEVTIVKPITKLTLEDYKPSNQLISRLEKEAEGIILAGTPGSGKTTLASSLANFYSSKGKIVKTFESPKDMQLNPEVTQYGPLEGSFEKTADILLLVRPDYTIFDEVRKTKDFQVFADMRLSGVGMIGVVHSSKPIDAIQRFMGRVELGLVPHIIDTVIYVKEGAINKIYFLKLIVKVPTGMTESDLARPVVEVREFETDELVYEIYTYGDENIIIPVDSEDLEKDAISKLAEDRIMQIISPYDPNAEIIISPPNKAIIKVDRKVIPRIIGRGGAVISEIERKVGLRIDVESKLTSTGSEIEFDVSEKGNSLNFSFNNNNVGRTVNIYIEEEYLFSATVGAKSKIRVSKKSEIGKKVTNALISGTKIKALT